MQRHEKWRYETITKVTLPTVASGFRSMVIALPLYQPRQNGVVSTKQTNSCLLPPTLRLPTAFSALPKLHRPGSIR